MVGRTHVRDAKKKTTVPLGYNAKNLFMMSPSVREWIAEGFKIDKIYFCEGEIDFLHMCSMGQNVIGIRAGAIDHLQLLPWKNSQKCYIATDADEKGEQYAELIPPLVEPATCYRVKLKKLGDDNG